MNVWRVVKDTLIFFPDGETFFIVVVSNFRMAEVVITVLVSSPLRIVGVGNWLLSEDV